MFDVDDLQAFVTIAELGSLSRAAEALGRPKSTASRQILRLERQVGAPLLERSNKAMRLTDAGRLLHGHALQVLSAHEKAAAAMAASLIQPRGTLRVNVPHLFASRILAPRMSEFIARFPEVDLVVDVAQQPMGDKSADVDVSIRVGPVGNSPLIGKKIAQSELRLYASPTTFADETQTDFERDLDRSALIEASELSAYRQVIARQEGSLRIVAQIWEPATRHAFVLSGMGASWLPAFICELDVKAGRLASLLSNRRFGPIDIWALFSAQSGASPKVRAFLDFLGELDIMKGLSRFQSV